MFDAVFCPGDPATSAHWNPLSGLDPIQAARDFAAALYPDAGQSAANLYEARAVYAITRVAPAIALTAFVPAGEEGESNRRERRPADDAVSADPHLMEALERHGVAADVAFRLVRGRRDEVRRQLAWLPYRRGRWTSSG